MEGFCIRCHKQISFNKVRPFCTQCFDVWKAFIDEEKPETFCHKCGELTKDVSFAFPICQNCTNEIPENLQDL